MLARTYGRFGFVNAVVSRPGCSIAVTSVRGPCGAPLRILDIGAGGGDLCRFLAGRLRRDGLEAEITALDTDERAIRWASAHDRGAGVRYRRALSTELVDAGETFDVVLSNHVLHHLDDAELQTVLEDSRRLLAPGGWPRITTSPAAAPPMRSSRRRPGRSPGTSWPAPSSAWTGSSASAGPTRSRSSGRSSRGAGGSAGVCRPDWRCGGRTTVPDHDVLIVGAGPVGLLLACLLTQDGLRVVVCERRADADTRTRAIGIHRPGLDALEAAGLGTEVRAEALRLDGGEVRSRRRTLASLAFPPERPVLILPQPRTDALLRARLRALAPGMRCAPDGPYARSIRRARSCASRSMPRKRAPRAGRPLRRGGRRGAEPRARGSRTRVEPPERARDLRDGRRRRCGEGCPRRAALRAVRPRRILPAAGRAAAVGGAPGSRGAARYPGRLPGRGRGRGPASVWISSMTRGRPSSKPRNMSLGAPRRDAWSSSATRRTRSVRSAARG